MDALFLGRNLRPGETCEHVCLDFTDAFWLIPGDPEEYAFDWQDQGVYLDNWDKRKMEIEISGTEKDLLAWLVDDYGMDKKDAQKEIKKGKRIKI